MTSKHKQPLNKQAAIATLDIEASGIHPESYPIEIGICLANGKTWCSLIKPSDKWTHWDKEAEAIHGISHSDLIKHGKEPEDIAQELNSLLNSLTVYSDCSVLDQPWLNQLFQETNINPSFCLRDMMYLMEEEGYEKLIETKQQIAKKLQIERHRASNDARILKLAYEEIVGLV